MMNLHVKKFIHRLYKRKMFKSLTNFLKSDKGMMLLVAIIVIIVGYSLFSYSKSKGLVLDAMTASAGVKPNEESKGETASKPAEYNEVASTPSSLSNGYTMTDAATPEDLLPADKNSEFAQLNPVNTGNVDLPDMLQAGSLVGIDTIGQTLKNPNMQLRSDPVIDKKAVGPWNNSTYEPDLGRVPLELGDK